jgi:tRNA(His) 5'-end guanylyltransferase
MIKNKFEKPFDKEFIDMMNNTAKFICQNVQGVKLAYTQSDEITLIITKSSPDSEIFFGGRLCKLQSVIAALATSEFNRHFIRRQVFDKDDWSGVQMCDLDQELLDMKMTQFDCKAWNVDTLYDAILWLLFRNIDCVRNSKQQAAQTYLSHKALEKLDTDKQIAKLLEEKGIDWNQYPDNMKYGRFIKKAVATVNGANGQPVKRRVWNVYDGKDLTILENRTELLDYIVNIDKEIEKEIQN